MRGACLVLALAFLAGCSSGTGRPVRELRVVPDPDGVQRVRITAHSFWFDPNRVVLKAGAPAEVRIKNGGPFIPHNLTCAAPQAGIHVDENLGLFWDGETARFTPTTPGEYAFYCDHDGHAKKGMKGVFVVVP
jgi:plastocyanin